MKIGVVYPDFYSCMRWFCKRKYSQFWKLDARYNKAELTRRIEKIATYRDKISIYNMDAIDFIKNVILKSEYLKKTLVYLDPPYYIKGSELYLNHYKREDHVRLATFIRRRTSFKWIMSYDNVPKIHELYSDRRRIEFDLRYCAQMRKIGRELLICSKGLKLPTNTPVIKKAI